MKKVGVEIAVVGGGAAGFFAAIHAGEAFKNRNQAVLLLEKTGKTLQKVKVSGGGRCNVTHRCFDILELCKAYPRGGRELRGLLTRFGPEQTIAWFQSRGIALKTEPDGRMFPVTDSSQTIIDCLTGEVEKLGVLLETNFSLQKVEPFPGGFLLFGNKGEEVICQKLIVATGGNAKAESYNWLIRLGHSIVSPVPSLFTFNLSDSDITQLQGVTVANATVSVEGFSESTSGPLLITHWGFSGPAILKLSSLGARWFADQNYQYRVLVSWLGKVSFEQSLTILKEHRQKEGAKKTPATSNPVGLPSRLWAFLVKRAGVSGEKRWADLNKTELNNLAGILVQDCYSCSGKTTFKEEFVTCGGINLKEVDFRTMESKLVPGLFFAGEVLDIDAITGGFNFQAAWSTGRQAGLSAAEGLAIKPKFIR